MTLRREVPEWGPELAQKAVELHQQTHIAGGSFKDFTIDQNYTTHFAEFELRDGDMIVHIFPRVNAEDTYFPGRYINRCIACKSEVPPITRPHQVIACDRCGKTGRIYVPGRLEQRIHGLVFKEGAAGAIRRAVNDVWMGDAAMDYVKELDAYAVKFIRASSVVESTSQGQGLLDRFLEKVDAYLEALP